MEPRLVAFLTSLGLPAWLLPDSLTLVGLAGCVGGLLVLRQARLDGADVAEESRALAVAFAAAWIMGLLFEVPWALPAAWEAKSLEPLRGVDRNLLGGVLGGAAAAGAWCWLRSVHISAHLDRSTLLWTVTVVCTRLGCILEGCNFGRPTTAFTGWLYPPGSFAAKAHEAQGWIPPGAASLPVHPTAAYELVVALVAFAFAWGRLRLRRRDGSAFLAWLGVYAAGRLVLEGMRADAIASPLPYLARGQLLCLAVLTGVLLVSLPQLLRKFHLRQVTSALLALMWMVSADVRAQEAAGVAQPQPDAPDVPAAEEAPAAQPAAGFAFRLAVGPSIPMGRNARTGAGIFVEVDALRTVPQGDAGRRLEFGLELRRYSNRDATHWNAGLALQLIQPQPGRGFDLVLTAVPGYTYIDFESRHFDDGSVLGLRFQAGVQRRFNMATVGLSPLSVQYLSARKFGTNFITFEPRLWVTY